MCFLLVGVGSFCWKIPSVITLLFFIFVFTTLCMLKVKCKVLSSEWLCFFSSILIESGLRYLLQCPLQEYATKVHKESKLSFLAIPPHLCMHVHVPYTCKLYILVNWMSQVSCWKNHETHALAIGENIVFVHTRSVKIWPLKLMYRLMPTWRSCAGFW